MRRLVPLLMLLLAALSGARAQAALRLTAAPGAGQLCQQAIQAAERAHGIPPGLLAAMGRVEAGRPDPHGGTVSPWPWTIDVEGHGAFFDTEADAIAAVRASQARGLRSIDVGCLQVNLLHHPLAFANLATAFDPGANADYAARFLRQLFGQTGSWMLAAGLYHSATPELATEYRQRVMAAWPEQMRQGMFAPSAALTAYRVPLSAPRIAGRSHLPGRMPVGWSLAPKLPAVATPATVAACPFAALVGCARIYRKALH